MTNVYNWPCFKVLPLVYDESLSYYEVLCKLTYKIDEIIQELANDNQAIYEYINQQDKFYSQSDRKYTDDEIAKLQVQFNQSLNTLTTMVISMDNATRAWVLSEIQGLENWIKNQEPSIFVVNPITGALSSIQETFDSFYNLFNVYGLTCGEYDMLGLTCDEYDDKNLTCHQYDVYAKKYLWRNMELYMVHPATGKTVFYQDVIYWLADLHRTQALTCGEYDGIDLSCSGYDAYHLTCYNYDWYSKDLLN